MSAKEIKRRETYSKELGQILVRRHGQNYHSSFHNARRITTDDAALRFGRYLQAARVNAGLSPEELARLVNLSRARLTALEQGLVLACDIKPKWLKELAWALEENYEDFNLILGRKISSGNSRWLITHVVGQCRNWLIHSKKSIPTRPIYATCVVILLCLIIGSISIFETGPIERPPPQRADYTFVDVAPKRRFNMVEADLLFEDQIVLLPAITTNGSRDCCPDKIRLSVSQF